MVVSTISDQQQPPQLQQIGRCSGMPCNAGDDAKHTFTLRWAGHIVAGHP
jgi:hypothetical protein